MFRIAKIRDERGLTQADLAAAAGIRSATLSVVERGEGNPELETLKAIAAALNVRVVDLFEPADGDATTSALRDRLESMPPERRQALLDLLGD